MSAPCATPCCRFVLFVKGVVFELIVKVLEGFFVLFFDFRKHFEGVCDVFEAFRTRRFFKGFVQFDFGFVVFGGEGEVVRQIPFFLERISCGDVDVVDLLLARLLNEGVQESCVIKFVVHDFVHRIGECVVALIARAVFDKLVSDVRLRFADVGACEILIGFAVLKFHMLLLVFELCKDYCNFRGVLFGFSGVKRNIFICNQNVQKSFIIRAEVVSLYRNKVWRLRLQKELYI